MNLKIEISAISFLLVPPSLQFLWRDCLIGHCSNNWQTLKQCREIGRIAVGECINSILGEMEFDNQTDDDGEWKTLTGHFVLDCNYNVFEKELSGIDLNGNFDSVFWVVDKGNGNGFTRWKLGRCFMNDDGNFEFYSKTKMERKNGTKLIYKMKEDE